MRTVIPSGLAILAALTIAATATASQSIEANQIDRTQIYFGMPGSFETAGEVTLDDIIEATPEYREIQNNRVKKGTGKYWILLSQANDRAIQAITNLGNNGDYDLIAETGYLGGLDPPIEAVDLTKAVIKLL